MNIIKLSLIFTLLASTALEAKQNDHTKVIYGEDDRLDLFMMNAEDSYLARSTATRISDSRIRRLSDKESTLQNLVRMTASFQLGGNNLCKGEQFSNQFKVETCSGFLVGPTTLITAGHCSTTQGSSIANEPAQTTNRHVKCAGQNWVFGIAMKDSKTLERIIPNKNIYKCKRVIKAIYANQDLEGNPGIDYSIIELDRPVVGRRPLSIQRQSVSLGDSIKVIGYPSGLPVKVASNAQVKENKSSHYFSTNLDTFSGNSGSSVFSRSGKVVGILVRGKQDYIRDKILGCNRVNICNPERESCKEDRVPIDGEHVTRMTVVLPHL